ncbi:manganese efflux pump, partial [Cohnella sp.]|uniref:manganese efflux pump n=1 Tax=Cohnella sp. TaxID=1883426 RepID=UPI00356AF941
MRGGVSLTGSVSLLLLALAVSLDGFGVGVTYGLRGIRVPWVSIAIIAACSGLMLFIS